MTTIPAATGHEMSANGEASPSASGQEEEGLEAEAEAPAAAYDDLFGTDTSNLGASQHEKGPFDDDQAEGWGEWDLEDSLA